MSSVDDDRIGVGNIDSVLDYRGGDQHIELAIDEVHNELLHILRIHTSVPDCRTRFGADSGDHTLNREQVVDSIMHEIDLSAACQLCLDCLTNDLLAKQM